MTKTEVIRHLKGDNCRSCLHLHFKGKWRWDDQEKEEFCCGKNVTSAHNEIKDLPEELYCNEWEENQIYNKYRKKGLISDKRF